MRCQIDDVVIQSLKIGAVFHEPFRAHINSLDFHREDALLVTASDDDCLQLFDTHNARHLKSVSSRKYGCRCVTYTHHPNCVLVGSAKGSNHAVRYLSLHDNRWLRFFDGHTERVSAISMSPSNDSFLTASDDQTIRLWDLRDPNCSAVLHSPGLPCCAFDQQGLVFGISSGCGVIKLFDIRSYAQGSFATFAIAQENCAVVPFSCLKFSYDGQKLIAVNENNVYVVDAFEGHVLLNVSTETPQGGIPLEASFTPDGQYVIAACYDRKIRIWNLAHVSSRQDPSSNAAATPSAVVALEGHTSVPSCIKWAPSKAVMASGCQALALWIPSSPS